MSDYVPGNQILKHRCISIHRDQLIKAQVHGHAQGPRAVYCASKYIGIYRSVHCEWKYIGIYRSAHCAWTYCTQGQRISALCMDIHRDPEIRAQVPYKSIHRNTKISALYIDIHMDPEKKRTWVYKRKPEISAQLPRHIQGPRDQCTAHGHTQSSRDQCIMHGHTQGHRDQIIVLDHT